MTLVDLSKRQRLIVEAVKGSEELQERLYNLGIKKGQEVEWMRRSPWGGPIIVKIGAGLLALRKEEAECVQVKRKLSS
ncbi:MAG: ferrous iron transport protein A [Bdellovibrio sp.]|nr:MAG: ferrous iron transport protein A [Bdellovibrio sp.]